MSKTIETISHIRIGNVEHPIDAVTINGKSLPTPEELLPSVSNLDEGEILMVLQGQWNLFTPSDLYDDINGVDCGDEDFSKQYLTFEILTSGTIGWYAKGTGAEKTIQYSINGGEWTSITSS